MPLITCPDCKQEVSDQARSCPKCGYPLARNKRIAQAQEAGASIVTAGKGAARGFRSLLLVEGGFSNRMEWKAYVFCAWVILILPVLLVSFAEYALEENQEYHRGRIRSQIEQTAPTPAANGPVITWTDQQGRVEDSFGGGQGGGVPSTVRTPTANEYAVMISRQEAKEMEGAFFLTVAALWMLIPSGMLVLLRIRNARKISVLFLTATTVLLIVSIVRLYSFQDGILDPELVGYASFMWACFGASCAYWVLYLLRSDNMKSIFSHSR